MRHLDLEFIKPMLISVRVELIGGDSQQLYLSGPSEFDYLPESTKSRIGVPSLERLLIIKDNLEICG